MYRHAGIILCAFALLVCPSVSWASIASGERGANIAPMWSTDFDSEEFKQSLRQLKADHANAVSLVVPIFQANIYSSEIYAGGQTPSDASIGRAIDFAHSLGLSVTLKPHLDPQDGQWRANIDADRAPWFASYGATIKRYASLAQAHGAESLIVGTELIKMSAGDASAANTPGWRKIIADVRSVYSGTVSYAANWGPKGQWNDEKNRIAFWDAVDYIAIDAYFKLGNDYNDNSVATFKAAWEAVDKNDLGPLAQRTGKRIVFSEIGYKSTGGAHLDPGDYYINNGINLQEQDNAYEALFSYWNNSPYLSGVYLWEWSARPNPSGQDTNYSPQNKPAEITMKNWFSGGASSTPPASSGPHALAASAQSATVAPGSAATISASVTNTGQAEQGIVVDIEVYDSAGARVLQKFYENESIPLGTKNYSVSWTPSAPGTYQIKVGVFGPGWTPVYAWNGSAGTVAVSSGTPTPPPAAAAFTASASAPAQSPLGQAVGFTASAKATGGAASALVDVEVYDSAGQKKFQQFFGAQSFAAGEIKSYSLSWTPPAAGTYRITSAVFSPDWSKLYVWNNEAAAFSVVSGQPQSPPPPSPTSTPPASPPPSSGPAQSPIRNGNVQIVVTDLPKQNVVQGQQPSVGASLISQGDNANNVSVRVQLINSGGAVAAESRTNADILHDSQKSFSLRVPATLSPGDYAVSVVVLNNADGLLNKRFDNIGTVRVVASQ
ncbi:MAG: hypothetical protein JWL87_146 [Candidatus Adlerbacteria bacterium]|nr:hypothetical protein [Candidatus Adlerbacteria bacterium]